MEKSVTDKCAPLIKRQATDPIAYISQPLTSLDNYKGIINAQQFLAHVLQLATVLPQHQYAVNLCGNRYLFMVALCAVIIRKQTNLLPPNKNTATQQTLNNRYADSYVIHDGVDIAPGLGQLDIAQLELDYQTELFDIPVIALDHLAAISFTSGSTGNAKPNAKSWHTFIASTNINQHYMLKNSCDTFYQLATVPGQHMWGLETSVLMALFANVCIADAKPLFPQDVQNLLTSLPEPRMLTSTPVHLRALVNSNIKFCGVDTVLCATSPLTSDLAQQVEILFQTELREVYGCSEIGSMAVRNTAQENIWHKFDGIEFNTDDKQQVSAGAAHIPERIELQDHIEIINPQQFKLAGRTSDMVNIAGKRGSLYEINKVLQTFPGLIDGIVFFPSQTRTVPRLVAFVVIPENIELQKIVEHFRQYLDNAFVPRPIIKIDALPREENGKLPQRKLLALYQNIKNN